MSLRSASSRSRLGRGDSAATLRNAHHRAVAGPDRYRVRAGKTARSFSCAVAAALTSSCQSWSQRVRRRRNASTTSPSLFPKWAYRVAGATLACLRITSTGVAATPWVKARCSAASSNRSRALGCATMHSAYNVRFNETSVTGHAADSYSMVRGNRRCAGCCHLWAGSIRVRALPSRILGVLRTDPSDGRSSLFRCVGHVLHLSGSRVPVCTSSPPFHHDPRRFDRNPWKWGSRGRSGHDFLQCRCSIGRDGGRLRVARASRTRPTQHGTGQTGQTSVCCEFGHRFRCCRRRRLGTAVGNIMACSLGSHRRHHVHRHGRRSSLRRFPHGSA